MKILITGGAGYIGTELTYRLAEQPEVDKVIIYDNLSRSNYNLFIGVQKMPADKVSFVKGDLLDSRKLRKVVSEADVVFHLAAKVTTPLADQNPHFFEQTNHWGTAELTYALEESNVQQLIYLSSVSVYGAGNEITEINAPLNPKTFYGISKMRGEEHVQRLMEKIPTYVLRCGNIYGYSKSMRFDAVINKFMFEANFNNRISIHGDGSQKRAFIHIDKVTAFLSRLMSSQLDSGTYNLVDRNISIREVAANLTKIYPDLEMLFINQHLKLREISVHPDSRLKHLFPESDTSFIDELNQFKEQFTFSN